MLSTYNNLRALFLIYHPKRHSKLGKQYLIKKNPSPYSPYLISKLTTEKIQTFPSTVVLPVLFLKPNPGLNPIGAEILPSENYSTTKANPSTFTTMVERVLFPLW